MRKIAEQALLAMSALAGCHGVSSDTPETTEGSSLDGGTSTANPSSSSSEGVVGAVCGDGIVESSEQCDTQPIYGVQCPATCAFAPGVQLWELFFDSTSLADSGTGITIDSDALVVVGSSVGPTGLRPLLLWVSHEGVVIRSITHDSDLPVGEGPRTAVSVAHDGEGYVVAGADTLPRAWLARFSDAGALMWETNYAVASVRSGTNVRNAAFLLDGRVALFGDVDLADELPGFIAFFVDGDVVDEQRFAGPPERSGYSDLASIQGLPLSDTDCVVVGGAFSGGSRVPWIQRRASDGNVRWQFSLPSTSGSLVDEISGVAERPDGSIAVVAYRNLESSEMADAWIGVFSPEGDELWEDRYVGEYHRNDYPSGIVSDDDGNLFVHLTLSDDAHAQEQNNHDSVVIKYGPDGERIWLSRWSGPGSGDGLMSWDYTGGIAVDADGFVAVVGKSYRANSDYDVVVRRLAP